MGGSGPATSPPSAKRMVERQLRRRGIGDERVLAAMAAVPRELFVPERHRRRAYADSALPIGDGQTISQPWIVAAICQALELRGNRAGARGRHRLGLLDGGPRPAGRRGAQRSSGSPSLAEARPRAARPSSGRATSRSCVGDGSAGLPERAPVRGDRRARVRSGAAPEPARAARPRRSAGDPARRRGRRHAHRASALDEASTPRRRAARREIAPCRFVPLIGEEGFRVSGQICESR